MDDVLPRSLANGRYELSELLGRGGAAHVYLARDRLLDVQRAIKVLGKGLREHYLERFLTEARAMALLQHPNVVTIYDVGSSNQDDYIVMELAAGGSLSSRVKAHGPLQVKEAVRFAVQTLSALSVLHAQGIIHRDVKPSNILLTDRDQAKLTDFGIALLQSEENHRTEPGTAMGTRSFMPPEQRLDSHAVGPQADLYSVGTTLYALITRESPIDLAYAREHSDRWLRLPADLRAPIQHACALSPQDRPASARELAVSLMEGIGMHEAEQAVLLQDFHGEVPRAVRLQMAPQAAEPTHPTPSTAAGRRSFAESLKLRADALDRARAAIRRGEDVSETLRRVAKAIASGAEHRGYPELAAAARELQEAPTEQFDRHLATLRLSIRALLDDQAAHHTVVIVEDDPSISGVLRIAAQRHAQEVIVAPDAQRGREHLQASHPSLVLLDLFLPDDDGRELLMWMRDQPHLREVPVVVVSGRASEQVRSECLALGADELLPKPVDLSALDEVLRRRLAPSNEASTTEDRDRFLDELQRENREYHRHRTPCCVALVAVREDDSSSPALTLAIRAALGRHLPDAVTAVWDDGVVAVLLKQTPAAAAELGLSAVLTTMDRERSAPGVTLSAGVVEPMGARPEDAMYLARRMSRLARAAGPNQVVATTCDRPAAQRAAVIDDDPSVMILVQTLLEHHGAEVLTFSSGDAVLESIDQLDVSLIVLDVQMPGSDGLAVLETLRAHPRHLHTPIVMLTGIGDEATIERAFDLGADDYVTKPFQPRALAARLSRLLKRLH